MSSLLLAVVEGYLINVGDISTAAPHTVHTPGFPDSTKGSKITFMSKATSIFIPDLTPEQFMDRLVASAVKLDLPD
jgi:hypothetical protein